MIKKLLSTIFICYLVLSCTNQKPVTTGYQGQGKNAIVSTLSKPVQKQWKGIWSFEDETTFLAMILKVED
ncbi:hypothetical protein Q2T41_20685 [Maribacter confluentis]|uniref:Uncharacterized protein n=1 Tax=Maribacter confluentis TaxID=1656093 RepID=A0ABT8RVS5_9FLAO|nr:hypothetical protein [Maribacter confluentis]MDO1515014.1 hypothetical protein [Maribacter confluentis]